MERKNSDNECPVRKSMQIFAGKWTLLIIYQINSRIIRYGELKRAIPGISEKMLINELKFLYDKGLIAKKQYPEVPPRVEYSLTPLGEKVLPIIDENCQIRNGKSVNHILMALSAICTPCGNRSFTFVKYFF